MGDSEGAMAITDMAVARLPAGKVGPFPAYQVTWRSESPDGRRVTTRGTLVSDPQQKPEEQ